jgi:predicted O-methyltransferase YrrM
LYNNFTLAKKYFTYYLAALSGKGHGMHSPFVYQFILHVLNNKKNFIPPSIIEAERQKLLQDDQLLTIEDLGAGSRKSSSKKRTVSEIAKRALKSRKYASLLYRLAAYYQPQNIIELGTSLGITTAYLSTAAPGADVITIEGSDAVHEKAISVFKELGLKNINAVKGDFDTLLPAILQKISQVDLAYVDGNHRGEPTMNYFRQLVDKSHNDTIIIFDDIHWSLEMENAWKNIKADPRVTCSIDIFFLGFVFFRKEFKEPRHFTVRF